MTFMWEDPQNSNDKRPKHLQHEKHDVDQLPLVAYKEDDQFSYMVAINVFRICILITVAFLIWLGYTIWSEA